jgi:CARDB protein
MNRATRRLGSIWTLIVAVALLLAPAADAKPKPKPKLPDLTVKASTVGGQPYAVIGEDPSAKTQFEFTVFNEGKKSTGRKTVARVQLVHSLHGSFKLGYRAIPELKPGHGDAGRATTPVLRAPAGAYRVRACADVPDQVRESNENNNCDFFKLPGPHYYVANDRYKGTVSGNQELTPSGGWYEYWQMPSADFGPAQYLGNGAFTYNLTGSVYYNDSGGTACTVTGSGVGSTTGELQIQFEGNRYVGTGSTNTSYPIFKCGNNDDGDTGPKEPTVLETVGDDFVFPTLQFGNHIEGTLTSSDGTETWNWTLDGAN